jgi:hypothetical protein
MRMTPEQVTKLRMPPGFSLIDVAGEWILEGPPNSAGPIPLADVAFARLAEAVADGELDESVLIAAWATKEGKIEYYARVTCPRGDGYYHEWFYTFPNRDAAKDYGGEYGILIKLGS